MSTAAIPLRYFYLHYCHSCGEKHPKGESKVGHFLYFFTNGAVAEVTQLKQLKSFRLFSRELWLC